MSDMRKRWAARRRLAGLVFLGGAAVAIAIAVLLFTLGHGYWAGALAVTAAAFLVHAGFEFFDAYKYARLAS